MATAQSRVTDMTRGDPVRLLLNFSAPLFLSNLLQQFYNIADTLIVGRVLGQGGFGITYLALDTQLDAKVAIKEFMPGELATRVDGTTVSVMAESKTEAFTYGAERFQEEARTLAKFMGQHLTLLRLT